MVKKNMIDFNKNIITEEIYFLKLKYITVILFYKF